MPTETPVWTITNESVSVVLDGEMYTLKSGDKNFAAARAAVFAGEWDKVPALVSRGKMLEEWAAAYGHGKLFAFREGLVHYKGYPVPQQLNQRMLTMAEEGGDPTYLMRFWDLLDENPSNRSVFQLYSFLAHNSIAIDQDGYVLAYKGVQRDYTDYHSGEWDNSVGRENSMPRNQISDDPRSACSEGFHVGALKYAKSFGSDGRLVICRVHPKDVVCIPYDSSAQKMRCCAYKVIGHYGEEMGLTHDTSADEATRDLVASADSFADKLTKPSAPPPPYHLSPEDAEYMAPKAAEPKAAEPKANEPEPEEAKPEPKADEPWLDFHELTDVELVNKRVADLRKYASRVLGIVGAYHLRKDGKGGLLDRIADVRQED